LALAPSDFQQSSGFPAAVQVGLKFGLRARGPSDPRLFHRDFHRKPAALGLRPCKQERNLRGGDRTKAGAAAFVALASGCDPHKQIPDTLAQIPLRRRPLRLKTPCDTYRSSPDQALAHDHAQPDSAQHTPPSYRLRLVLEG